MLSIKMLVYVYACTNLSFYAIKKIIYKQQNVCIYLILCKTLVLHLYTWALKHIQQVAYKDNTLFHQTDFLLFISTKNCVPHFSCDCQCILGIVSKAMRNKWNDKKLSKRTKHGDKNILHCFISFEPLHKHRYINICCINKIWLSVW